MLRMSTSSLRMMALMMTLMMRRMMKVMRREEERMGYFASYEPFVLIKPKNWAKGRGEIGGIFTMMGHCHPPITIFIIKCWQRKGLKGVQLIASDTKSRFSNIVITIDTSMSIEQCSLSMIMIMITKNKNHPHQHDHHHHHLTLAVG